MALRILAMSFLAVPAAAGSSGGGTTCGDIKTFYKSQGCCGHADQELTAVPPGAPACPYNFNKPACSSAEPQTPRDLSTGATGKMVPKAAVLTKAQASAMPLVNVHFHLGAEHKSDAYSDHTDSDAYDAKGGRRLGTDVRPGFMCPTTGLDLTPYTFEYCKGQVEVGKSYEIHYVHSSAGYTAEDIAANAGIDGMDDGLGGAANGRGLLNPMVVVQGQVFQIAYDGAEVDDMLHGWTVVDHSDSVMYSGSTTGPSHNNEVCSPYVITWHVDKACHKVTPASFDKLCKQMKEKYNLLADLYPHGSRVLVDPKWVVKSQYVTKLA